MLWDWKVFFPKGLILCNAGGLPAMPSTPTLRLTDYGLLFMAPSLLCGLDSGTN